MCRKKVVLEVLVLAWKMYRFWKAREKMRRRSQNEISVHDEENVQDMQWTENSSQSKLHRQVCSSGGSGGYVHWSIAEGR